MRDTPTSCASSWKPLRHRHTELSGPRPSTQVTRAHRPLPSHDKINYCFPESARKPDHGTPGLPLM